MKSLERVIKQKYKFRGNNGWGEENYFNLYKRSYYENEDIPLYISHDKVSSKNIIILLTEMKALIVFLFSCIQYDERARDTEDETRELRFELKFLDEFLVGPWGHPELDLSDSIFGLDIESWYNRPTQYVKCITEAIKRKGHHVTFDKPFIIILSLIRWESDRFIDDIDDSINNNNNEEIIPINEEKTFKSDLCAICLEKIPNVLFCSCGHICICEECNKTNNFKKCPICKTENNILRIT